MFGKVKEVKTGCPRFQNLTSLWLSTRRKADRRLPKADCHQLAILSKRKLLQSGLTRFHQLRFTCVANKV